MIFEPGTWSTANVPATGHHVVQFFDVQDNDACIFLIMDPYTINFVRVDWAGQEPLVTDMNIIELPLTVLFVDGVETARTTQLRYRRDVQDWLRVVDPA